MTTEVIDTKIKWLLDVASRIQSIISGPPINQIVSEIIFSIAKKHKAVIAHDTIASDGYPFLILTTGPSKLFRDVVDALRAANSKTYQDTLNPITITTKLMDREYLFMTSGTRLCYGIVSSVPSNYLLKSIACRIIASVKSYRDYVDEESFTMIQDRVAELHPLYDYSTKTNRAIGGKKVTKTTEIKKKANDRINIISRLIEYVRGNRAIAQGIIFINNLDECSSSALGIIYTEHKYKDGVVDYLKLLIAESYSTKYSFKSFLHNDFSIPYDFRQKKYTCILNDKLTAQAVYITNMFNIGEYDPVPCVKSIINESYIYVAHPIVKLRILYLDMFMIEHKTNSVNPINHERLYHSKMMKAYNDLLAYNKTPHWVGYYNNEAYQKNKFNQLGRMNSSIEEHFI